MSKISEKDELKIKSHYEIALELIKSKQIHKAKLELYNRMPIELYDASLDILDNRNMLVKTKKLKELIDEVHEKLMNTDINEQEENLEEDNFNNQF